MFTNLAIAAAVATLILGLGWLFAGPLLMKRWQVEPEARALLVGQRLGAVYFGVCFIMWFGRHAGPSDLRDAVMIGTIVTLVGLGILGTKTFLEKKVGPAMLVSVAVEVILSVGFAWVLLFENV